MEIKKKQKVLAKKAKEAGFDGVNYEKIQLYNQKKEQLAQLQKEVDKLHDEIVKDEKTRAAKDEKKQNDLMGQFDSSQIEEIDAFAKQLVQKTSQQISDSPPIESSLLQLRDDNLANVEIDAGDATAEAPLGQQASELTANDAIEQSAAIAGTEPQQTTEVQVAEEQTTTKAAEPEAAATEAAATETAAAETTATTEAAATEAAATEVAAAAATEAAAAEATTTEAATTTKSSAGDGIGSDSAEVKETAKKFAQMQAEMDAKIAAVEERR